MAYSSDCFGTNSVASGNVVLGHTNINGKTNDASTNVYMIGRNLKAEGNASQQMVLGFGNRTTYIDNTTPIITFGTSTSVNTRPSIAMFGDPGEANQASNLVIGGDAGRAGTSYTYQDGIGSGCLIFADNSTYSKAPTATIPNAVSLYIGDRSIDGTNGVVGGKGLIIKGENSGRTFISDRVGINVSHNSAKDSQINEGVEAGLHIYGEGNTNATSALRAENSDGDVLLEVKNDGNVEFGGQVYAPYNTLTDGATITPDFNDSNNMIVTLAGNRAMANPSNLKDGASYTVIVKQDATGSRTLSFGTAFKWAGGTAPTLSTGANAVDILTFISDGTNLYGSFVGDFQ